MYVDINAQHQARGHYTHETAVDGAMKQGTENAAPGIPKNPDSSRNAAVLQFRSFPRGPRGRSAILPIRSAMWGPVRRSMGVDNNAIHQTRGR